MTSIVIHEFGGMQPRVGDEFLPSEAASDAENCLLLSGELRPLHVPARIAEFYPPNTHAENTKQFGPIFSGNPWEDFEDALQQTVAPENIIIWVKPEEVISNASAVGPAVSWTDYNTLNNTENIEGVPVVVNGGRYLDFNPLPWSQAVRVNSASVNWFLQPVITVTQTQTPPLEGPVVTDYYDFNEGYFNTSWFENSHPKYRYAPPGWPVAWAFDSGNLYAWSTNPAVPPENLPDGDVGFWVRDGSFPSDYVTVHQSSAPITERGISVDGPSMSGVDVFQKGQIALQSDPSLSYNFQNPVPGPPFTTAQVSLSALQYTPYTGKLCQNPYGLTMTSHTVMVTFKYDAQLPGWGSPVASRQVLWAMGATLLEVRQADGHIWFVTGETSGTTTFDLGLAVQGQEYWIVCTVETVGGNNFTHVYVDGVEVVNHQVRWRPGFSPTDVMVGRTSMNITRPDLQGALISKWGQFIVLNRPLTPTEVSDLYAAGWGAGP